MSWTWLLVTLSLAGNVLVIRKQRAGFALWIMANIGWGAVAVGRNDWAQATLWATYTVLATWGWLRWSTDAQ